MYAPARSLFSAASLGKLLGFGSTANAPRRSHETYLSQPRSLHDRILAFQYEGMAPAPARRPLSAQLRTAIRHSCGLTLIHSILPCWLIPRRCDAQAELKGSFCLTNE